MTNISSYCILYILYIKYRLQKYIRNIIYYNIKKITLLTLVIYNYVHYYRKINTLFLHGRIRKFVTKTVNWVIYLVWYDWIIFDLLGHEDIEWNIYSVTKNDIDDCIFEMNLHSCMFSICFYEAI